MHWILMLLRRFVNEICPFRFASSEFQIWGSSLWILTVLSSGLILLGVLSALSDSRILKISRITEGVWPKCAFFMFLIVVVLYSIGHLFWVFLFFQTKGQCDCCILHCICFWLFSSVFSWALSNFCYARLVHHIPDRIDQVIDRLVFWCVLGGSFWLRLLNSLWIGLYTVFVYLALTAIHITDN